MGMKWLKSAHCMSRPLRNRFASSGQVGLTEKSIGDRRSPFRARNIVTRHSMAPILG